MAISGDYSTPVQVNGYSCRNCTDVDYAKKHIDPAHPKDGPYGVDAPPERADAVKLGGALSGQDARVRADPTAERRSPYSAGSTLDVRA